MAGSTDGEGNDSVDWDTEDELEIQNSTASSWPPVANSVQEGVSGVKEPCAGPSCSKSALIPHFVGMGFSEEMIAKAIEENGQEDTEAVLETLLTYSALEKSCPPRSSENKDGTLDDELSDTDSFFGDEAFEKSCPPRSSENKDGTLDDELSDTDSFFGDEQTTETLSEKDKNFLLLVEMGFPSEQAASAMDRCGPDASLAELTDSIYAAQTAMTSDTHLGKRPHLSSDEDDVAYSDEDEKSEGSWDDEFVRDTKKTKLSKKEGSWRQRSQFVSRQKHFQKNIVNENDMLSSFCIPKHMIGFGIPTERPSYKVHRKLPEAAIGPPYFYYENVALTPKGVWETISRFLYDIEPEFVDSKFFCATARKRGYIHNLPIQNRFPLLPLPPRTIHEALPMTKKWWPSWDTRTQLNCLQTCTASAKLTERIRTALANSDDPPPLRVQQYVLNECRKWNLVWVGLHKVAPLEPDEIEMLLGFPRNHTRGGGISRTERFRSLGNSFQVDTVAYHLSVLKDIFPNGITLLSLFSGIGGAEVALHRLGIPLKTLVAVEISEINRNILRGWWEQTNQKGTLIDIGDVQQLNGDRLEKMITTFGGFDLVIGGSPCNNLTGSNRVSRDGLEGKDSALFYDYFRILDLVKCIMGRNT